MSISITRIVDTVSLFTYIWANYNNK